MYDTFGPPPNEVEKKVKVTEEKLKAMEESDALGLDAAEMCLVPRVVILAKFKVPEFEKYKGTSDQGPIFEHIIIKWILILMTTYSSCISFETH